MEAGDAFQVIALMALGGMAYAFFFRVGQKGEEKTRRTLYYRRIVSDLINAERHYSEQRERLAGLLGMDEIAARQALEDAKFASRGMIGYEPSDFHYITEAEAERMLALTRELKAADATVEAAQEAAMAGSNTLPALHEDLMRRIDHITEEAGAVARRFKPKTSDYYWSE